MRNHLSVILGCFCLLTIAHLSFYHIHAQTPRLFFKYLNTRNGLSSDNVRFISQDKEGFMWFATEHGVDRYDGKEFRNYLEFFKDSTYSMMQTIRQISSDSHNGLWFFNDTSGLVLFNKVTKGVVRFRKDPDNKRSISDNRIRSVFEDSERNIWITTLGGGLNLFNRSDSTFNTFRHDSANPESIGSDRLTAITEDVKGNLWISSPEGLLIKLDKKTGKFKNIRLSETNLLFWENINSPVLYIDSEQNIWFGNQQNLIKYDQNKGLATRIPLEMSITNMFTNITSIFELEPMVILIATSNNGLYTYHSKTGKSEHYIYNMADPFGINSNRLSQIFRSKDGVFWIGSYDNGINIYSKNHLRFPQLMNLVAVKDLENSNYSAYSLCETDNGTILVGTENNGIFEFNPKNNTIDRILPELKNYSIFDMYSESGKIWISTYRNGLYSYDIRTRRIKDYKMFPGTRIPLFTGIVRYFKDSHNRNWFGSIGSGLAKVTSSGKYDLYINNSSDSTSLLDNIIYKIFEDSHGNIWIGTNLGLHLYDEKKNRFKRISLPDENGKYKTTGLTILDIYEDHNRQLWIGTPRTLYVLNSQSFKAKYYPYKIKDTYLRVIKIFEDSHHLLWLGTNAGVCNFNPDKEIFKEYGISDGTFFLENNPNAGLKSRKGYIYFGTTKGVIVFSPENIKDDTVPPEVFITYVGVNDVEIEMFKKSTNYDEDGNIRKLKLTHKQSTLEIHFAALSYNNSEANQFAYQLEGYEKAWIHAGNKNVAYYPNLPPGKYTFRVMASNSHGYWNETGKQIQIQIASPVWKRLWFKILVPVILIFLVISRIFRLRKKKAILEGLVKERTKALNDANLDLQEHHEELRQQHEEITSQNEQLSQMSEEIIKQNIELEQHRTNLEKLVEERTQELEKALKKAEESDRLKSAFLANMSHEIRTPMNAIVGFANLLKDNELSQEEKTEFIDVINTNSETLLVLIDDILDLSLIEANQLKIRKEIFSINEMLDHLSSSYSLMNRKNDLIIRLNNELHGQDIRVNSDRIRIKQILSNLMNNAYKFTEKGHVELGVQKIEGKLSFYVKDTGIGIEEGNIAHVFERFRKTESGTNAFYRGTGLGLAISKALATLLDGKLTVESEFGKGSTFRFGLPWTIVTTEIKEHVSIPVQADGHIWSGRDILIVEDEQANYLYAKKLLNKLKVNIHWAENGEEAVRLVDSGSKFHIILMDIKMPVMDGFEATKLIKSKYPDQIVIALTAYARPEDRIKFMQAGFDDYLAKPIKPNDFLGVIRRYI